MGSGVQNDKVRSLEDQLKEVSTKMIDTENIFLLAEISNDSCVYLERQILLINEDLKKIADKAIAMEQDLKTTTTEYQLLKKNIIATRIRYWLFAEKTKMICSPNMTTILYFYAIGDKCKDCYNQGLVLEYINSKMNQTLVIAPVDIDEDLETIKIIKETYGITTAPTLILDNSPVLKGLISEKELSEYICNKTGQLCI